MKTALALILAATLSGCASSSWKESRSIATDGDEEDFKVANKEAYKNSPSSFHALLLKSPLLFSQKDNQKYGTCVASIRKFLNSGKTFESEVIKKNSVAVEDFPHDEVEKGDFYHYSPNFEEVNAIAVSGNFEGLFSYPRVDSRPNSAGWFEGLSYYLPYFYVAADSVSSSRSYGPHLFKIKLKERINVFKSPNPKSVTFEKEELKKEMVKKYAALSSCPEQILSMLAIEASDIGAIAYLGISNSKGRTEAPHQWFQIVGPWAIESMVHERSNI